MAQSVICICYEPRTQEEPEELFWHVCPLSNFHSNKWGIIVIIVVSFKHSQREHRALTLTCSLDTALLSRDHKCTYGFESEQPAEAMFIVMNEYVPHGCLICNTSSGSALQK